MTADWDTTEKQIRTMMEVKIDSKQAEQFFSSVIGSEDIENSVKAQNILEKMTELYNSGTHQIIPATNGTVFGAYASVLEWCDTEKTVKSSKIRSDENEALLHTKINGSAAKQKAEAHAFAWKMCEMHNEDAYA